MSVFKRTCAYAIDRTHTFVPFIAICHCKKFLFIPTRRVERARRHMSLLWKLEMNRRTRRLLFLSTGRRYSRSKSRTLPYLCSYICYLCLGYICRASQVCVCVILIIDNDRFAIYYAISPAFGKTVSKVAPSRKLEQLTWPSTRATLSYESVRSWRFAVSLTIVPRWLRYQTQNFMTIFVHTCPR